MISKNIIKIVIKIYLGTLMIFDFFSLIMYISLLIFLIKGRLRNDKLVSKEFHTLCIFNGILDVFFIIEEYFAYRIPLMGLFQKFYLEWYPTTSISGFLYIYSLYHIIYVSLSAITLTFNRYYAIVYPLNYKFFWSNYRLVILTIWPALVLFPILIFFYDTKIIFTQEPEIGRMAISVVVEEINKKLWEITLSIHIFALIINGCLNIMVIREIKNHLKMRTNSCFFFKFNSTMAKFAAFYFFSLLILVILEILIFLFFENNNIHLGFNFLTLYTFAQSLIVFYSPYALIITNNEVGKKFFKTIGIEKFLK
ncbi:7TM GPCR, serpentine receptor class v (Srv) family-containing protein [Strongyloides ratti]|uniref:7TM GPCR, serpentine receptor class v (Srv) family-containing protein n=1 Tax=Strongyloides ratti TaxID=34506 RepID=A0A090MZX1_STRRB|nr:7TM GPCR, serpentine receptor class v (Srv) family-containing protein [Strongyloides ratti]CEF69675.1 7TM GPCR, serpentine receptor class v (Srv) family-containing protein [Strongyloides ratti]